MYGSFHSSDKSASTRPRSYDVLPVTERSNHRTKQPVEYAWAVQSVLHATQRQISQATAKHPRLQIRKRLAKERHPSQLKQSTCHEASTKHWHAAYGSTWCLWLADDIAWSLWLAVGICRISSGSWLWLATDVRPTTALMGRTWSAGNGLPTTAAGLVLRDARTDARAITVWSASKPLHAVATKSLHATTP